MLMQSEQTHEPGWQFNPDGSAAAPNSAQPEQPAPEQPAPATQPQTQEVPVTPEVTWSASEFVAYHKPAGWYAVMILATVVLAGIVYFLTRDFFAVGAVVVMAILFLIYANHKPRVLTYTLSNKGLQIGSRMYQYGLFRSFAVQQQGNMRSIMLVPLQRLKPPIDMYFDPQDEQKITNALSQYLPHEERKIDAVDSFLHRIRF